MAEPRDSMLHPKCIGGIIGNKGYAFQNAYILHRLPDWLADPTFAGLQPEGWEDVEVFFEDEDGRRREAIQVKDHPVPPPRPRRCTPSSDIGPRRASVLASPTASGWPRKR